MSNFVLLVLRCKDCW